MRLIQLVKLLFPLNTIVREIMPAQIKHLKLKCTRIASSASWANFIAASLPMALDISIARAKENQWKQCKQVIIETMATEKLHHKTA